MPDPCAAGKDEDDAEIEVVAAEPMGGRARAAGAGRRGGADGAPGGALTRDILRAEEELSLAQGDRTEAAAEGQGQGLGEGIVLGGRRKAKGGDPGAGGGGAGAQDDMQVVRDRIDRLCQVTNPLGRYLELLAEDADGLSKELGFWREERRGFEARLEELLKQDGGAAASETRDSPVLKKLDEEIAGMRDNIVAIKAQILANDEQVARLLGVIVK